MHHQGPLVQEVYAEWEELDSNVNGGYYYEAGSFRGQDRLAKAFSDLLAHPLQRGDQQLSQRDEKYFFKR